LCLLLNIDGLVEELGLRPVLARTCRSGMSTARPLPGVIRTLSRHRRRTESGIPSHLSLSRLLIET